MEDTKIKILILAGSGRSSTILFHELDKIYDVVKIIQESPVKKSIFLHRRARKLGWWNVLGQVLFMSYVKIWLSPRSKRRTQDIIDSQNWTTKELPFDRRHHVSSINAKSTLALIQKMKYDVVVVNGTRILSKKLLNSIQHPIVNLHAGITPNYRGVHGGYWALIHNDITHCGVTLHYVDAGIDTGGVIDQRLIHPSKADNFTTYPLLQLAAGIPALIEKIPCIAKNDADILVIENQPSRLWHHPSLYTYLYNRLINGIR